MFQRFTGRARHVVVLAQEEARRLGHGHIGTEHLLLGLLREEQGIAARALASLGVTIEEARAQVERIVGTGEGASAGQIPFTPRAKKVLELALREAVAMQHGFLGTEHILLGLVREGEGVGAQVLAAFGAGADAVREVVLGSMSGAPAAALAGPRPWPGRRHRREPPRWEYRVEAVEAGQLAAEALDELGGEGWELVTIVPDGAALRAVFKRMRR